LACLFYLVLPNQNKELPLLYVSGARFAASIINNISIKLSAVGKVEQTIKTRKPLIDSS
jgi:hypothetical protein